MLFTGCITDKLQREISRIRTINLFMDFVQIKRLMN